MNKETQEYAPEVPEKLERVGVTNLRTLVMTGLAGTCISSCLRSTCS